MSLLDTNSLSSTIDSVNQELFEGRTLSLAERTGIARWIAGLRGRPGAYAGMFAPTEFDHSSDVKTFTGERLVSRARTRHVLGEEACRMLILLDSPDQSVKEALKLATSSMVKRLAESETEGRVQGLFCCGTCSAAYWRHTAAGGLDRNEERLTAAIRVLSEHRAGDCHWRRFPFYYTVLALSGMDFNPAVEEMRYAAPALERCLRQTTGEDMYSVRRRRLAEKVLAKC